MVIVTGYMYEAQNYISGDAQSFRQTFEEQLKNGSYDVQKIELYDTLSKIDVLNKKTSIKEVKTRYIVKKVIDEKTGLPKRIPNEISTNNILISQVILTDVKMEANFLKRLENQRDESAKRHLEQQKTKTAIDTKDRIIAEGERDKASEMVKQQKLQVSQLIEIDTRLKVEESNKKLANMQYETSLIKNKTIVSNAKAKAEANKLLANAGLSPDTKIQWQYKSDSVISKHISELKLPQYYINSNGKSSSNGTSSQDLLSTILLYSKMNDVGKK